MHLREVATPMISANKPYHHHHHHHHHHHTWLYNILYIQISYYWVSGISYKVEVKPLPVQDYWLIVV